MPQRSIASFFAGAQRKEVAKRTAQSDAAEPRSESSNGASDVKENGRHSPPLKKASSSPGRERPQNATMTSAPPEHEKVSSDSPVKQAPEHEKMSSDSPVKQASSKKRRRVIVESEDDSDVGTENAPSPTMANGTDDDGGLCSRPSDNGAHKDATSCKPSDSAASDETCLPKSSSKESNPKRATSTSKRSAAPQKVKKSKLVAKDTKDEVLVKLSPADLPQECPKGKPAASASDEKSTVHDFKDAVEVAHSDGVNRSSPATKQGILKFVGVAEGGKKKTELNELTTKTSCDGSGPVREDLYDPSKEHYHAVSDAIWNKGAKVPYLACARTFEAIENISGRLKIIETLSNFLRSVIALSPDDLLHCLYLCLNQLAPAYEGVELGVGDTVIIKALAEATGRSVDKIKADAQKKGDLGLVAEVSRSTQKTMFTPPKLLASSVFAKLKEIASLTGNAVMAKKTNIIKALLIACRHSEARYLVRSIGGKLRIGLAEQSVLTALGQAVALTPAAGPDAGNLDCGKGLSADALKKKVEDAVLQIKTAYCQCPNYDRIVDVLLHDGLDQLTFKCRLTPGIPLKPMLAHPTKGVADVLKRFEDNDFACEFKYDGERAQIHLLEGGAVHIYSRNQEDNTSKYPDIVSRLCKAVKPTVTSCIIDTEAVAWDREAKRILPFQVLSTRKRKDADAAEIKVQVCVYAFDMLYLNGESLVEKPLRDRRQALVDSFQEVEGEFAYSKCITATDSDSVADFLDEAIKGNCEGLMVKTLDDNATYEIAKRSHNWLKLKKDYLEGVGDTLDLVVIGAYHGTGKRTGRYGGFLLACYDPDNEEYQTICKIGTGFKDEDFQKHTDFFKDHIIERPRPYYRWDTAICPDHWIDAVQVWEVRCADLSISPVHRAAAGLVDPEKGISLRFPRFIRIRDDKKPADATSSTQVSELYQNQCQVQNQAKSSTAEDEDYY